ncbi:MAG: DUF1501 domain-containing protein [Planctomycetota bacterium]|nr:DUF1501 domain-containing protein [Planctomycetota bacterium]
MSIKDLFNKSDECCRRDFVVGAASGLLAVGAMPVLGGLATAQGKQGKAKKTQGSQKPAPAEGQFPMLPATAKNVIYLYMSGGISHLDTFDTKPGADNQGPIESINTNADGVQISQYFPELAKHMDKVAVINSLHSTQGAHAQGRYFMHTSYPMRGTIKHPSIGAWLNRMAGKTNPTLPAHVGVGIGANTASAGFFESKYAPLPIGDPKSGLQDSHRHHSVDGETFDRRLAKLEEMNRAFKGKFNHRKVRGYEDMYKEAIKLMQSDDLAAFDIRKESEELKAAYGDNQFGQGCLLARRLIEHNVRFVEVVSGGWDTHTNNFEKMEDACPNLDQSIATLLADLEARGLLDETLVVFATEFGRTPDIVNNGNGRNHFPKAFSGWMAGGGIVGGQKYGKTDARGAEVIENPVAVQDFNATIAYALGLPLDFIIHSPSGRPFQVAHKGKPVRALFG